MGLDMKAAKEAFSEVLDGAHLSPEQIYFVNQVVEYVVRNGMVEDNGVLMRSPFTDRGGVADLFGSDLEAWQKVKGAIDSIRRNAETGP